MMRQLRAAGADTFVSDEPFYGCFLKSTGADHPGRKETVEAMDCDWSSVMRSLRDETPDRSPIWYQKHMWHHMAGPIGFDDFEGFRHAFLIREPKRMIASYLRKRRTAVFENFGLDRQAEFFERETDRLGHSPPVVDANDILSDPAGVLSKLCSALGIEWSAEMLSWVPGRRATDGPWAPYWYGAVEKSTGFGAAESASVELDDDARRLAERCRPLYEQLAAHRLRSVR